MRNRITKSVIKDAKRWAYNASVALFQRIYRKTRNFSRILEESKKYRKIIW